MLDRATAPIIKDPIHFNFELPAINTHALSNGVPLYWLHAGVLDVVEINWIFDAGIWQEPHQGVANATAAILKNGTLSKTAKQINEDLELYGASLKIGASNDYACITLHCLVKHLAAILPTIASILFEASFPEEELEIFKKNALQRLAINLKQCEFVANQKIDAHVFGAQHPYGRYTTSASLEALSSDMLRNFHKAAYQMNTCKIFMAGKVGPQEIELINRYFGATTLATTTTNANNEFAISTEAPFKSFIENDANAVQGAIRIARTIPNRHHPDFAPLVVLNTLFGGYFGSRLMSNIREDKGYTYGIYSSQSSYIHSGMLCIQTEVGRDVLQHAVDEIYKEMDLLLQESIEEEELLLVKNYLLGSILGDLDGPFSILQRWRSLILNGLDQQTFQKNIHTYKNITAIELQQLAEKYYNASDFFEIQVV